MGGGGFSMEESPLLDLYVLKATGRANPKVCFLATASGDSENYILRFYRAFSKLECRPTDLSLFRRTITDLTDFVCSQDIIYVGGGNTANLLSVWKTHGLDKSLKTAYENGTVLCGLSAGSICWFQEGVTDSFGNDLEKLDCLGFLSGSNCPHYNGEANRRPAYFSMLESGMKSGLAVDDSAAAHFIDEKLVSVVSSLEGSGAYEVGFEKGKVYERPLPVRYLG